MTTIIKNINDKLIDHLTANKVLFEIDARNVTVFPFVIYEQPKDTVPAIYVDTPFVVNIEQSQANGGYCEIEVPIYCVDKCKPVFSDDKDGEMRVMDLALNVARSLFTFNTGYATQYSFDFSEVEEIQNKIKNVTLTAKFRIHLICAV